MQSSLTHISARVVIRLVISATFIAYNSLVFSIHQASGATVQDRKSAAYDTVYYGTETVSGDECSSNPAGTIGPDFGLGDGETERQANLVQALMEEFSFTPEQAAGPVGNFMHESGGKHLPPDVNEGGQVGPPKFDGGYGWAQWTAGRQESFIDFAVKNGYMESKTVNATDSANMAYLLHELKGGYKATVTELKKQKTPEDAAVSFEATFERAGGPALTERKKNARIAFNAYTERSGGTAEGAPSSSACGTVSVDGYVFPLLGPKSIVKNPGIFRNNNTDQAGHPYIAYDILTPKGTKVVAFMNGTITYSGVDRCNVKFITVWNEEKKLGVTYMHLSDHKRVGKVVKAGDEIGTIGKGTGDPGCETEHLHIDAAIDKQRQACSRLGCTIQDHFRDIGRELYATYQVLDEE